MTIKAGDIVCLKSGSPEMTVERIYSFGRKAECTRFATDIHETLERNGEAICASSYERFSTRGFRVSALELVK